MPVVCAVFAASMLCLSSFATDGISRQEYQFRRETLKKSLADGITILFGRTAADDVDSRCGFLQEPNFYYLTGWREPGAILLLNPHKQDILFLPHHDVNSERYIGRRPAPEDANIQAVTGFNNIQPVERFKGELAQSLEHIKKIYTLDSSPRAASLRTMFPLGEFGDATKAIGILRLKKSPAEINLIRHSLKITIQAHRAAWKCLRPGLYEYQLAARLVGSYLEAGCERSAYTPIVGSGINATVLHYSANSRRMQSGDLVLIDAGAECSSYAADITRTIPVDGRFTLRQRELYQAVLGAQKAVIAAVKPGMTFERGSAQGLTEIAVKYLDSHGTDNHGNPLGRYLTHKVGHHVGLEVHDAGAMLTYGPLEAGMVITIEPGVYIPQERIGIRIEDMLLVTNNGAEVLSSVLPSDPGEIERAMAR